MNTSNNKKVNPLFTGIWPVVLFTVLVIALSVILKLVL